MMGAISVTGWQKLELPRGDARLAAFRVSADVQGQKRKVKLFFDVLLLGRARTVTMLALSSYDAPFGTPFEQRLVRAITKKMTSA